MTAATSALSEPAVLAHTKRRLFPADAEEGYAVVDTQFSADRWLASDAIDPTVRETLSPFNHVRVGSGYPDLVGVQHLTDEFLDADTRGEERPLIVVEAKGDTSRGDADIERGIVQAYDRLNEANAAYVAAPRSGITDATRTLARELNVGVLGVTTAGDVEPIEVPRVVGNRRTTETSAIRFQASAQGVTDRSFGLNHPKNYLAYPLALEHHGETEAVLAEFVVGAVDAARKGAAFLGLIEDAPDGPRVTPLGREVIRFARREYGSLESALEAFESWKRSRERFCDLAPKWGLLTRRVVYAYPATKLLVEELQAMHDAGSTDPSLPELVEGLHESHPTFTVELFVRGEEAVRSRVLDADGTLQIEALAEGDVYHAPTVFQLKAMLFHAGILTSRGAEPSNLEPLADVWALREAV